MLYVLEGNKLTQVKISAAQAGIIQRLGTANKGSGGSQHKEPIQDWGGSAQVLPTKVFFTFWAQEFFTLKKIIEDCTELYLGFSY